jgi:hypothetical protein
VGDSPENGDLDILMHLEVDCENLFTRVLDYINTTGEAPMLKWLILKKYRADFGTGSLIWGCSHPKRQILIRD